MSSKETFTLSSLSLSSEDWDRSESDIKPSAPSSVTPRNSVIFSAGGTEDTPGRHCGGRGGRPLSELMRLHAEKGTDVTFTTEEASRVADVLKQWINSGTSPYEGEEDDFFTRSHDDSVLSKRCSRVPSDINVNGRPRRQSEGMVVPRSPKPDASTS